MEEIYNHLSTTELESALEDIKQSNKDNAILQMIVRRPQEDAREIVVKGNLSLEEGLEGDCWSTKGSSKTEDGSSHPEMQLNIMNSKVIELIAGKRERWPLAGDQLFIDMDLSGKNLPTGTKLSIGEAVIEVTAIPHMGCKKFVTRFGLDAMKFVNSAVGRELHLRGINAKVVKPGAIKSGDVVKKI